MNFEDLKEAYNSGQLDKNSNIVAADRLSEFPVDEIINFSSLSNSEAEEGLALLKEGRWARLILNGGMATRFGGKVKGICEVYDSFTFLDLKIAHTTEYEKALGLPEIPIALMNSPATHKATTTYLEKKNYFGRKKLTTFVQVDAPRLTVEGEIFSHPEGKDRAPRGHGDFIWALQDSGTLKNWSAQGISHFDFSNIDNLGSTIEPSLVGDFVNSKKSMGIEVVKKNPNDAGGAACLRDGIRGVLEGIYFDDVFDQTRLAYFSPNNLMFDLQAVNKLLDDPAFALPWNVVHKNVDGVEVVQFERIAIDTVFGFNRKVEDNNVRLIEVPREGEKGRFYPVKSPQDLEDLRDKLRERLQQKL